MVVFRWFLFYRIGIIWVDLCKGLIKLKEITIMFTKLSTLLSSRKIIPFYEESSSRNFENILMIYSK